MMRSRLRRFALVGLLATVIDVGAFVALRRSGWPLVGADAVALAVAGLASATLHRSFTLRGDPFRRWLQSPPVFLAVVVLSGAVDLAVLVLLGRGRTTVAELLAAKLAAVVAAALVRSVAHRRLLFRVVRRAQDQPACRPPAPGTLRLSVVVPAYNEAPRIAATIAALRSDLADVARHGGLEIVVVDDGSADSTAEVARRAGADVVLVNRPNKGKGGAVRAGILAASGRTIAFTDADLAYAPAQIVALLDRVEAGWDVVVGNRRHAATTVLAPTTWVREVGSRVVNVITQLLLLGQYQDTQCGLKAFRSDVAKEVFRVGRLDGFAFDIEVLHLVEQNHLSLASVPVEVRNTTTSTVRAAADGWRLLRDVLRVRRWSREGIYPPLTSLPERPAPATDTARRRAQPIT
jgi:dolichyl-phosphate beta-glucosyltransferase